MADNKDNLLASSIKRLLNSSDSTVSFKSFKFLKLCSNHPLKDVISDTSVNEPCILASLVCENEDSCDATLGASSSNNADAASVIGSPLKLHDFQRERLACSSTVRLSSTSQADFVQLRPVTASQARCLLSSYNMAVEAERDNHDTCNWPALWVMCDGLDAERTVYMSSSVKDADKENNNFSLSATSAMQNGNGGCKNELLHTISNYLVTVAGPLTETCKLPTIEYLMNGYSTKQLHPVSYIAKYDLIGSKRLHSSDNAAMTSFESNAHADSVGPSPLNVRQGYIEATVQWKRKSALLDEPPIDASATLSITAVSGDPRSSVHPLYNDICTIQGLISGLSDGVVEWSVVDSDVPLLERVKQLIEDLKLGDLAKQRTASVGKSAENGTLSTKHLQVAERQDLDFTEQLWNILRDCSSYSDLLECLQLVINSLHAGSLQPMVCKQNKTKLAELVRDSFYGRLDPKILSRLSPIELLVEIGFDKLLKDYTHLFLAKDLVTPSHLKSFTTFHSEVPFKSRFGYLAKLHRVLEMVVLLEQYLILPQTYLCIAARQALTFYETHDIGSQDIFTLPVQTIVIGSLVKSCRPSMWKVDYASTVERCDNFDATVMFSLSAPFAHCVTPSELVNDPVCDSKKHAGYYVTVVKHFAFRM